METLFKERVLGLVAEPVAILGCGIEGQSTLAFLRRCGVEQIELLDRQQPPKELGCPGIYGEGHLQNLSRFKTIVRSAGVYPKQPELLEFVVNGGQLTSQVQLFFDLFDGVVVGITGTMGKGSCVMMLSSILESAAVEHLVGGNIGTPVLDLLLEEKLPSVAILELSSFQLMGLRAAPAIAVVLRTTVEHLDWHQSVEEYRLAKGDLVKNQQPFQHTLYCGSSEGSREIAALSSARLLSVASRGEALYQIDNGRLMLEDGPLRLEECAVKGDFMLENMAAAAAVASLLKAPASSIRQGLKAFQGLPFRLQLVGEFGGKQYYNDSYATRPDATIAAVASFKSPLALILGGSDKGVDFSELFVALQRANHLRYCALIGQTAPKLAEGLKKMGIAHQCCATLAEALAVCENAVEQGGVILLSPACASFGLFRNYKERGEVFDRLVCEREAK